MNPIIIDMDDMSDSREVYESKPQPIVTGFIWLVVVLVAGAGVWAATFKMDIVVKGTGIVETAQDSSVVTNLQSGTIAGCYVSDGQSVRAGDILYTIASEDLQLESTDYENQLQENESRLEMLNVYLDWLTDRSADMEAYSDNPYYQEYEARRKIVSISMENVETQYQSEQDSYTAKQEANAETIQYYEEEIGNLQELADGVKNRVNTFAPEDTYYYAKLNDYITRYNNTVKQYEESLSVLQQELDDINSGIQTAENDIAELENTIQNAQNAISEANAGIAENQTADVEAEKALIAEKQEEIANAQAGIATAESTKETQEALAKEKSNSIEAQKLEKESALSTLETETIASIEASILTYQQNVMTANASQTETQAALDSMEQTGTDSGQENVVQTEIQTISAEISTYNRKETELENALKTVDNSAEKTQLKAPISGVVNFSQELTEGNYLSAGAQVMTIIPQGEDGYLVRSYIDNQDIAKIREDMTVKYEIAAFPSSEYGTMTGQVNFVSSDLKSGAEDGTAYYVVESTVDSTDLYNEYGEKAELKVGMYCETKIIIEQKSVLKILLEKIHLID